MMMRKILFGLMAAAMVVAPAFAQDAERPKKKMPSSPRYFTSLKAATKEAQKYDAPIFVAAVGKGTPAEEVVKDLTRHKFFKELAAKGFFVYTMRVGLSKKEKDIDGRSPKPLYDRLTADERALLDVICPPDKVRSIGGGKNTDLAAFVGKTALEVDGIGRTERTVCRKLD